MFWQVVSDLTDQELEVFDGNASVAVDNRLELSLMVILGAAVHRLSKLTGNVYCGAPQTLRMWNITEIPPASPERCLWSLLSRHLKSESCHLDIICLTCAAG